MQNHTTFKPLLTLTHAPINCHFSKNSDDFVVREVPLYKASGEGEHLMCEIQKKDLSTQQALSLISEQTGIKIREIGYAGLKDKQGMTTQMLSLPRKFQNELENFTHEKLKILSIDFHNNKLRVGHLKGNRFFIRLKKVMPSDALRLAQALKTLDTQGYANYFGYQRFGKYGDNAQAGREILTKGTLQGKRLKNPKLSEFLISAYQSDLFNKYLSKRVEISRFVSDFSESEVMNYYDFDKTLVKALKSQKQFYKILPGEVLGHYPFGKCFLCDDLNTEVDRFTKRDITSMGLLAGAKAYRASGIAKEIEDVIFTQINEYESKLNGSRRFAWAYLDELDYKYNEEKAHFSMSFFLQKGSYATVVLEQILNRDIFEQGDF